MALLGTLARRIPSTGAGFITDAIGTIFVTDPLLGLTVNLETFHEHGSPATYIKLAKQVATGQVGKWYPDCGASFPPQLPASPATNGGTTLVLPTDVLQNQDATLPPAGLIVGFRSGAAKGRWRQITGVSGTFSSTKTVTVNRPWATAEGVPAVG